MRDALRKHVDEISIHAPLRGRQGGKPMTEEGKKFQSTPPCGGDMAATKAMLVMVYFNPRPLAGATQCSDATEIFILFQSTPPCGGDGNTELALRHSLISIHAPLRGRRVHQ